MDYKIKYLQLLNTVILLMEIDIDITQNLLSLVSLPEFLERDLEFLIKNKQRLKEETIAESLEVLNYEGE